MDNVFALVGPKSTLQIFGINLVGVNAENGTKLLVTVGFVALVWTASWTLQGLLRLVVKGRGGKRVAFWSRQGVKLVSAILIILGVVSIWFDDPTRLATALGLVTAGLAFALQRVVTALAGYFVILRGRTFNVGDRITMGGVRGDVIALDFTQTTIMEMGQPPAVQNADPAMWVRSRQYTGRVVTVSNARVFEEPVFNYSREFPYIWEEMVFPITYGSDRDSAEAILLDTAHRHTIRTSELSEESMREMQRRYFVEGAPMQPRVYYRLTDNWLELTVRFIARTHGVRELKDRMSREILDAFDRARISFGASTIEITGLPALRIERGRAPQEQG